MDPTHIFANLLQGQQKAVRSLDPELRSILGVLKATNILDDYPQDIVELSTARAQDLSCVDDEPSFGILLEHVLAEYKGEELSKLLDQAHFGLQLYNTDPKQVLKIIIEEPGTQLTDRYQASLVQIIYEVAKTDYEAGEVQNAFHRMRLLEDLSEHGLKIFDDKVIAFGAELEDQLNQALELII